MEFTLLIKFLLCFPFIGVAIMWLYWNYIMKKNKDLFAENLLTESNRMTKEGF